MRAPQRFLRVENDQGFKSKRPYAIGFKSGKSFGRAGIWKSCRKPDSDEIAHTFAVIICEPNFLVGQLHDGLPVTIGPAG